MDWDTSGDSSGIYWKLPLNDCNLLLGKKATLLTNKTPEANNNLGIFLSYKILKKIKIRKENNP